MSVRLFVGNLPYDATEEEIRAHFSPAGAVQNIFVPLDRETGRKRGFAFVEFSDNNAAQEAIRLFNSQPFKGRPLAVNEARAKEARPPSPGGGYHPAGPRPAPAGGPRPMGGRPMGPSSGPPGRDFGRSDAGTLDITSRGDKPNRKQFGPDAKPFKNRSKSFRPEGGKKPFKEKAGGQLHSMDEEDESLNVPEIDNFAEGLEEEDSGENQ